MSLMPRRTVAIMVAATSACAALLTGAVLGPLAVPARASVSLSMGAPAGRGSGVAVDPASFSPGACMAFPPTRGDNHRTVFLDAGHGGIDPGAVGTTKTGAAVAESTVNLAVELDAMAILRGQGYRVVVSRTRDSSVIRLTPADVAGHALTLQGAFNDVAARDVCADKAAANLLIGIYMDAGAPRNAGSVTGYDPVRPFSAANLRLAGLLQTDVLGAMNAQGWDIPNEGVLPDTVLGSALTGAAVAYGHLLLLGPAKAGYFSTPSRMPGALIEPLFLTDPFEASIAVSAHGRQVIAGGIARAVDQYFRSFGVVLADQDPSAPPAGSPGVVPPRLAAGEAGDQAGHQHQHQHDGRQRDRVAGMAAVAGLLREPLQPGCDRAG
jgi:N-acetylmuramoyl-L-alanine amidase